MKRRIPILAVAALLLAAAAVAAYLVLRSPVPSPAGSVPAAPAAAGPVPEAGLPSAPESLRIATYNIQAFGRTKLARTETLTVLARIGASFDVMAVQEVGSNGSSASAETAEAVMAGYAARMNALAGAEVYGYVRADQYGAVYRTDRLAVVGWRLYSGSEEFAYPPLAFRTLGAPLDFVLLVAHVRPSEAAREIPALARAMAETAAAYGEPDVLCAGDFNADGSYYDEGEGASLAGFPEPDFISVVPNDADTTVAPGALAYDRMVLARSLGEDFTGGWAVMRPGELWDLSACEGPAGRAGTESALSDHYPVWAEFYTRRDTD
jgi:deoxyribonuclease-1-like protein